MKVKFYILVEGPEAEMHKGMQLWMTDVEINKEIGILDEKTGCKVLALGVEPTV